MATHSSILAWRGAAWQASPWDCKSRTGVSHWGERENPLLTLNFSDLNYPICESSLQFI